MSRNPSLPVYRNLKRSPLHSQAAVVNSSSNSNQAKSKVPTSKPKPINYYPANLLSAANTAKANIAKMMKSVEEMYTPTVDHHVSTYIQGHIRRPPILSELHVTKDGEGAVNSSESSDDDDNGNDHGDTNDSRQKQSWLSP